MKGRQRVQSPEQGSERTKVGEHNTKAFEFSFPLKTGIYPGAAMMSQIRLAPLDRHKPTASSAPKINCTRDMKINDGRRQIVALVEGNRKLEVVPGLINWLFVAEHLSVGQDPVSSLDPSSWNFHAWQILSQPG